MKTVYIQSEALALGNGVTLRADPVTRSIGEGVQPYFTLDIHQKPVEYEFALIPAQHVHLSSHSVIALRDFLNKLIPPSPPE